MRHFDFLPAADRARLFHREPQPFDAEDDLDRRAIGLGATLYSPATRPTLAADLTKQVARGMTSSVVCLEDAIDDADLPSAELNVISQLRVFAQSGADRPLLFVRVRSVDQIAKLAEGLGTELDVLTGFVLPKFTGVNGLAYLQAIEEESSRSGHRLLAMPVLESAQVIYAESRVAELVTIHQMLEKFRGSVLAVRLGTTDLSSLYGLRRSREMTVYDVKILADVVCDVINVLGRADGTGYVITGPVWEYFSGRERMFKPQLRESPFIAQRERKLRGELIAKDLDGLIREVALDKSNGLIGKTVIHPNHVAAVHALSVVTHEEYSDAIDVLQTNRSGGVAASAYRNKMNESKPHTAWAQRILERAHVFGVANESISFVELLGAGLHQ